MLALALVIATLHAGAQDKKECLADVLRLEGLAAMRNDSTLNEKNLYFNYVVKATNWDDEATTSDVKVYKKGSDMHFFSEQASIYMDENEVLVVMPYQKMLVLNSNNKALQSYKVSDDFFETRKTFLDCCLVVKCGQNENNNMVLALKAGRYSPDESIKISSMVYEYNLTEKKIISVKVNYTSDYKLKQLAVFYKDFTMNSTYKFPALKSQFIDKKGNVKEPYRSYELVDNRDKKNKSH